jgi:hypothetical protein
LLFLPVALAMVSIAKVAISIMANVELRGDILRGYWAGFDRQVIAVALVQKAQTGCCCTFDC